ncbi:MAG: C-GCAxxG-C-C family protein [Methanothrix sp.]|nr:C-GCAxxG-C-C family protein [Methanothrix sp.]
MTHADTAVERFKEGFNCAQSVLYSYSETLDMDPDLALRIATGFGGGMGRKQEVCGAVSGGILVLGLLHGRGKHDGKERVEKTYAEVRDFIDAFIGVHGTICCRELLSGCSLLTEEGRKRFVTDGLIKQCREYIRTVCDILDRQSFQA